LFGLGLLCFKHKEWKVEFPFKVLFLSLVAANVWLFHKLFTEEQPAPSLIEGALLGLLPVLALLSWAGLTLAELGWFSLAGLSAVLAGSAMGLGALLRRRGRRILSPPSARIDRYEAIALALAVGIGLLYARPAEWVVGGDDRGAYVNIGVHLARTGALRIHDRALAAVPPEHQHLVAQLTPGRATYEGVKYPAFYIRDREQGLVTPQFFHVLPVWIATLHQLGGLRLAIFATPLFAGTSVLLLYLLGRRLVHPGAGLVAMALLGLNISQLWFARNPFADVVLQCFLLGGLVALSRCAERQAPADALLAGACLGVGHLVKLDAFVVPPVVLGFVGLPFLMGRARRAHGYLLGLYAALAIHAAVHAAVFALPYVTDVFHNFAVYLRLGGLALLVGLPLLAGLIWQRRRVAPALERTGRANREALARAFAVGVLLLSAYAYVVRPLRADLGAMRATDFAHQGDVLRGLAPLATTPQTVQLGGKTVRTFVEEGIVRFGWYMTPLGVWLGIAGFLHWTTTRLNARSAPFLGAALLGAGLAFYRGAVVPHFFWAFKRYIPVVVPSFALCIAYALWQLGSMGRARWQQRLLPLTLGTFLLLAYVTGGLRFWGHRGYAGAIADLEDWAGELPQDGMYLLLRSDVGARLGTPLTYLYGRDTLTLAAQDRERPEVRALIRGWLDQGRPVYWITPRCTPLPAYHPTALVDRRHFAWPHVPPALHKLPDRIVTFTTDFCVYRVAGTAREASTPANLQANLNDRITLLGYELPTAQVTAGEKLSLALYWRAQASLDEDYKVFVHVVDPQATQVWGQKDHTPANGARPTSGWAEGEVIVDRVTVPIAADAPPGPYRLQVGMYHFETLARLPVLGPEGEPRATRVMVQEIQVLAPD
jgi:hypothetical protein